MEILSRKKVDPIHLSASDTLVVTYRDEDGGETILVTADVATHAMTVDEAVLFATTFEGRRALGGMVVEKKP